MGRIGSNTENWRSLRMRFRKMVDDERGEASRNELGPRESLLRGTGLLTGDMDRC